MTLSVKRKREKAKFRALNVRMSPGLYDRTVKLADAQFCSCAALIRRLLVEATDEPAGK